MSVEVSEGIEQNLVVKPEAHGKYEVIAGHRRRLAVLKLISEGKEEYRYMPCRVKHETDDIKDKLSLILTNSTTRELSDWEKVQQAKQLKELLTQYKKALEEENKGKPKEERERMGRIREIVAEMLNISTTQVGRMEAIENNLSEEFKGELKKGNINISTAHELSRQDEQKQKEAYERYEEKGKLHIKDVKEEQKQELTEEQIEEIQQAIQYAIKGQANRDIYKARGNAEGITKALRKHYASCYLGSKFTTEDGKQLTYRWAAEGLTIINAEWENFMIDYSDLAEIVQIMIEDEELTYDDMTEEQEESTTRETEEDTEGYEDDTDNIGDTVAGYEVEGVDGQIHATDYKEILPVVSEKRLDFTSWIGRRYGMEQYNLIKKVIRDVFLSQMEKGDKKNVCPAEWEEQLTNAISVWLLDKSVEYKKYLDS
jgi:ParB-like chromosome segregation protein Spo0J